nr:hypothetical protein [Saccharopolyspora spinosa]
MRALPAGARHAVVVQCEVENPSESVGIPLPDGARVFLPIHFLARRGKRLHESAELRAGFAVQPRFDDGHPVARDAVMQLPRLVLAGVDVEQPLQPHLRRSGTAFGLHAPVIGFGDDLQLLHHQNPHRLLQTLNAGNEFRVGARRNRRLRTRDVQSRVANARQRCHTPILSIRTCIRTFFGIA